jgi:hypothetical protein
MQMELAWRDGASSGRRRSRKPYIPNELLTDRGGMVFPPRLGFHENVAEPDFISEFQHHGALQRFARNGELPLPRRAARA